MAKFIRLTLAAAVTISALGVAGPVGAAGEAIIPGEARADATFEHIGVVWSVAGDSDHDSTMTLEFRPLGETTWRDGAPAVRAVPEVIVDGAPLGIDSWAASAMFLAPGTAYELRLTITDPDGGGATTILTAGTRSEPQPGTAVRHVVPGSGGGAGTATEPFRGLQAAADAASPGDTFEVGPGTYQMFELTTSGTADAPITFRGPETGTAVVDGEGTDRGVVTLGEFDTVTSHLIIEDLVIQDGAWGVDAQNTRDIAIRNNLIQDVDFGVYNRRANGDERNQTVCGNVITGRVPWPGSGIPGERGIDLRGWGNVVCNNQVSDFGDCISVQPFTGPSYGNDIFGNDAFRCVDDGIEIDYNEANVRVYRNRITNARTGVSVQPIAGGPAYIFRNEMFNLESSPLKLNNAPTGLFVAHNSGAMNGNGLSDGSEWTNTVFRNNLFLGTRYAFEFTTSTGEGFRDLDHNAWGTSRTVDPGGPWFKWDDVRYDRIDDLPAGVEDHGVEVAFGDLTEAQLPASWDIESLPGSSDLRLLASSAAVDGGLSLSNLNEGFVFDGSPDMGAFELGETLPRYGPTDTVGPRFVDTADSIFVADIDWLANEGITLGCNPPANDLFCPDAPVTRGQMAAFLVRALTLTDDGGGNTFIDDNGSIFEDDIARLAAANITLGCNPPTNDRFCPDATVTRGQMAAFLRRALEE